MSDQRFGVRGPRTLMVAFMAELTTEHGYKLTSHWKSFGNLPEHFTDDHVIYIEPKHQLAFDLQVDFDRHGLKLFVLPNDWTSALEAVADLTKKPALPDICGYAAEVVGDRLKFGCIEWGKHALKALIRLRRMVKGSDIQELTLLRDGGMVISSAGLTTKLEEHEVEELLSAAVVGDMQKKGPRYVAERCNPSAGHWHVYDTSKPSRFNHVTDGEVVGGTHSGTFGEAQRKADELNKKDEPRYFAMKCTHVGNYGVYDRSQPKPGSNNANCYAESTGFDTLDKAQQHADELNAKEVK